MLRRLLRPGLALRVSENNCELTVTAFKEQLARQAERNRHNASYAAANSFVSSIPNRVLVDLVANYANHSRPVLEDHGDLTAQDMLDHAEADYVDHLALAVTLHNETGPVKVYGSGLTRFSEVDSQNPDLNVARAQEAFDKVAEAAYYVMASSQARLDYAFVLNESLKSDATAGQDSTAYARACAMHGEPLVFEEEGKESVTTPAGGKAPVE